ncbi:rCG47016, partial [Rattus norvegicus]
MLISAKQEYGAQGNKYNHSHYAAYESMVRAILTSQRIGICKRMKSGALVSYFLLKYRSGARGVLSKEHVSIRMNLY